MNGLLPRLGSVRVVFADGGRVSARNDYYAFGKRVTNSLLPASADNLNRHLFNGKERQIVGLPDYLDYGARMYDGETGRWMTLDPLAEKYYPVSPYVYTANNPVNMIDPNGMEVWGVTRADAERLMDDFRQMFKGDEFSKFCELIVRSGKNQNGRSLAHIDGDALAAAFDGISLNDDQQALVDQTVGVINSEFVHNVEYVDVSGEVSLGGTVAFRSHINAEISGAGDKMIPADRMPGATMNAISGGGINFPTQNGSHSVVMMGVGVVHDGGRYITTGHEIIGHGVAIANGITDVGNNTRAIQVDNLMRRVVGIPTYRTEHGGAVIINPYALPGRLP